MLAIKIISSKNFMNHFLVGDAFDPFLMQEGILSTAITYSFDGHINKEYFGENLEDEAFREYEFQPWSEARKTIINLIKGGHTPIYMKFVLQLKPDKAIAMLSKEAPDEDFSLLKSLILNVKFEGGQVILTTGTSYTSFVMNKEADIIWDKALKQYLNGKDISFEEL